MKTALKEIAEAVADRADEGTDVRRSLQERLGRTPIFTVASKDYQKLKRITRGGHPPILNEPDTQIPALIDHLTHIGEGRDVNAHVAEIEKRLEVFLKEVRFRFRTWRQQIADEETGARTRQTELLARCKVPSDKLRQRLHQTVGTAKNTFEARREVFGQQLNTAVERSKRQLHGVAAAWGQMHWATLRATVSRDGMFVSPSSGQRYNLNEDVCRPLLDSIPFVTKALHWAKFKRDDMLFGADHTFMQVEKHVSKAGRDSTQAQAPHPAHIDTSSGTWRYNDTTKTIELTYLKISRSKETENGSRKAALYIHDITDRELWLIELFYVPKDQQGFTLAHYKKEDW